MNANRKPYGPFDDAVMDVIDELRGDLSGRTVAMKSGLGHNRTATILRRGTPPPTVGEVEALALGFGKLASEIIERAEQSEAFSGRAEHLRRSAAVDDLASARADKEAMIDRRLENPEHHAALTTRIEPTDGQDSP
ncbi:hypothetical protein [Demequina sp. SO4-18]|uniref:hypothetical protein n=1 Tax=Demequina sp. SO4-18 TaxID=3401026 RepID=UPI003B59DEF2